jgi:cytochrome c2
MKIFKRILLVLVILFVIAQFIRPARTNPPVDPAKRLAMPQNVQSIFDRSCRDCHSNQTEWPWYTNVSPLSWWVVNHVNGGRKHFNASEFNTYAAKKQSKKIEELCDQVEQGDMPLSSYVVVHRQAKLAPQDVQTLCTWSQQLRAPGPH